MPGWIRTVGAELWALFVDDWGLAGSAAVWIALITAGLHFGLSAGIAGPSLFLGLAVALLVSVWRRTNAKV